MDKEQSTKPAASARKAPPDALQPRLLNMRQVAHYLGCSFWTARDYILQGLIPAVEMPPLMARPGERPRRALRRVLVDRGDLDAFIEGRKRPLALVKVAHADTAGRRGVGSRKDAAR